MKKVVVSRFGNPDVLELHETAVPKPESDEVIIKVAYAGVGAIDGIMRAGKLRDLDLQPPFTPGIEVSGTVSALGDSVDQFAIGQPVVAIMLPDGGYAEYVRAKASLTTQLRSADQMKPAASLVNLTTAHLLFTEIAQLRAEDTLAIHGASGGLGTACIVMAKLLQPQAKITATVRQQNKKAYVKSLGCEEVLTVDEFLQIPISKKAYSIIVDPIGGDLRRLSITALKPYGQLLAVGNVSDDYETIIPSQQLWLEGKTVSGFNLALYASFYPDKVQLAMRFTVDHLGDEQTIPEDKMFPLSEVKEAHAYLQGGALTGRILLEVR